MMNLLSHVCVCASPCAQLFHDAFIQACLPMYVETTMMGTWM